MRRLPTPPWLPTSGTSWKKAADAKLLEIKEAEQTIDSFRRQADATLDEQKRRMRDKILDEIKSVVNAKAKAANYTMVVDSAAESVNGTPVFIYLTMVKTTSPTMS